MNLKFIGNDRQITERPTLLYFSGNNKLPEELQKQSLSTPSKMDHQIFREIFNY